MFRLDEGLRADLHREPIDSQAGMDSLVKSVKQAMQLDLFFSALLTSITVSATA
jgi:hypothetical protein